MKYQWDIHGMEYCWDTNKIIIKYHWTHPPVPCLTWLENPRVLPEGSPRKTRRLMMGIYEVEWLD